MKNQKNYGFTLNEVLVAIIIGSLITILVGSTFVLNQRVFRKNNLKTELVQNSRITLDLMSREIRQAQEIVTALPANNSNPSLIAHQLQFQDGHVTSQIQYIRYYLENSDLKRQIIIYYFDTDPANYVYWNDINPFGSPQQQILEDKIIGENFSNINFYGQDVINIDLILNKQGEHIEMKSIIKPRNI
ncbi:MAG: prepilin-type N-terminal cleavage/methylation domain-containing protein [Candidatus Buchananbacteria bacterium]